MKNSQFAFLLQGFFKGLLLLCLGFYNMVSFFWMQNEKTIIEEKRKLEELSILKMRKEKDDAYSEVSRLEQEFETTKATYEKCCMQLEMEARETKLQLEKKLNELESELDISRKKVAELEEFSESKYRRWKKKEIKYQRFIDFQCGAFEVPYLCCFILIVS